MKKLFFLILGSLLISVQTFSQAADQEAIKKTCLAETQAFYNRDYNSWASYHVQSADEQLNWNKPDSSFGFQSGWNEISKGMEDWFKTAEKDNSKISSDNFTIVIRGNMAFAAYNANAVNINGTIKHSRENRTLLKINNQWKILAVEAYLEYPRKK